MAQVAVPIDRLGRFAFRASLLFALLILLNLVVGIVLLSSSDRPVIERALAAVGPIIWTAFAIVLISGLGWRTWATGASIVVLWGLIVAGAIEVVVAVGQGRLHFPIGLVLAVVVLRSVPAGVRVWSGDRAARLAATAAIVVVAFVTVWPLAVGALLKPGASPLAVGPDALELALGVDCSPPFAVGEPVVATVQITWLLANEWLTTGEDGVVVEWYAETGSSEPAYFSLDGYEAAVVGSAVWEADQNPGSASFGLEVRSGNQVNGQLDLTLRGDSRRHGELVVRTTYAHLDRWTKRSDSVTCAW